MTLTQSRIAEVASALGAIVSVIGFALEFPGGKDSVTTVGLGLFLGGVFLSVHDIQARLKEQRDEQPVLLAHRQLT
ncbi:MAG TPA: hypothetical protein VJU61_23330, partial [Polyangiaceae bacterium]|nr:hypothetical protein [Polyangiaceae bacterium]